MHRRVPVICCHANIIDANYLSGTTKSWKQYRDLVLGGCGLGRIVFKKKRIRTPENGDQPQALEFERLPSLHNRPSEEERKKGIEAETRVRMFVKDSIPDSDSSIDGASIGPVSTAPPPSTRTSLGRLRAASETRTVQFHRPRPVVTRNGRHASSGDIGLGTHAEREDPVIQYERQDWGHKNSERDRRFVDKRLPPIPVPNPPHSRPDFLESASSSSERVVD
jgi:hypothetical protein